MKYKKMPTGGKLKAKDVPSSIRPSSNAQLSNDLYNRFVNFGGEPSQSPRGTSPSARFLGIEEDAYNKYASKPQKIYLDTGDRTAPLTQGKLRGATPSKEILNDLALAADRAGVPREQMFALAANESMFGKGYRGGGGRRGADSKGILQQNIISSWNMDQKYKPVPAAQFAYSKKIPGVKLDVNSQGYNYSIQDMDQYTRSLDSALAIHPEYIQQYQQANANVRPQGDINYFDLTAEALRDKGLSSSAFNPGDPDYANKIRQAQQLVTQDPVLKPYLRRGTAAGSMNYGGIIPEAASGIHIKKENRGKFTASAKRAGMGVQEYASHVLANKDRYSPTLVKRANFARNASKWNKAEYGIEIPKDRGIRILDDIKCAEMAQYGYYGDPLEEGKRRVSNYFQNDPYQEYVPNNASLQGPNPYEPEYLTNEEGDVIQSDYQPMGQSNSSSFEHSPAGGGLPNLSINAGAAISGLAGLVTKYAKQQQATDEFTRLKRRNATMQTYNPYAYGTGSQAIMRNGGTVNGTFYKFTPEQTAFLKKQGYRL